MKRVNRCLWLGVVLTGLSLGSAVSPSPAVAGEPTLTIQTESCVLRVGADGRLLELVDRATGRNCVPAKPSSPFMRLKTTEGVYNASAVRPLNGNRFTVEFGTSGVTAKFRYRCWDDFFAVELESVSSERFEWLELVRLPTTLTQTLALRINAARDDRFAVAVMAGSPETEAVYLGRARDYVVLGARCWPAVSTKNVRAVVVACPSQRLKQTIGRMELACGLPHPTVDGVWWKDSPEVRKGYLLCNPTGKDVDKAIAYAKQAGIPYIVFLSGTWTTSLGHYPVNRKNFPRGEADLKATVDKIHAQGMKAGLHFLSACIGKNDAYVTPVPDPRLAKDGQLTLAADIDAQSTVVPTVEDPVGFVTYAYYATAGGVDIQIDDEIIRYSGISHQPPYGFTKCQRGAYGTKPAPHKAGAKVWHLAQRYNLFLADPKTDLVDEIAERLAHVYNTCGFDMVYFDGGEAMAATGPAWYTVSLIHRAFYKRLKRPVLWQGSGMTHYSWHFFCRGNCDDYACLDPKAYCDRHKTPRIEGYYRANFIPAELGWWGYMTHTPSFDATVPDDIVYMCAKAVGWDAAVNLECPISELDRNGRTAETLERMRRWQELQHRNYFSDEIKRRLREPEMDFELVRDEVGHWRVRPVKYHPEHVADPKRPETTTWTLNNQLAETTAAFRLRAETELAPFGDEANVVLFDPADSSGSTSTKAPDGVSVRAAVLQAGAPHSRPACRVTVIRQRRTSRDWAAVVHQFPKLLNLSSHRRLGVWVYGDGQGELLNIQLEDVGHRLRDHYIDVDFTGWRYFVLEQPAARRVWDYPWPYNRKWTLRHFFYNKVRAVNVYLSGLPVGREVSVQVGRIEALHELPTPLVRPQLSIGGQSVTVPLTLKPDEYVEVDPRGHCRHFDPDGHLLAETECGPPPRVVRGKNQVRFSAQSKARARVTVVVKGEPL